MKKTNTLKSLLFIAIFLIALSSCTIKNSSVAIEIVNAPQKTEYIIDDVIDLNGLEVKVKYDNGEYSNVIDINSLNISMPDTLTTGVKTIIIKYTVNQKEFVTNFEINVSNPQIHDHSFPNEWIITEDNHWKKCEVCNEKQAFGTHTYDSGIITANPDFNNEGVKTYTCTVCGHTRTESIAKLEHNFASEWSNNGTHHWHICTDSGYETLISEYNTHDLVAVPQVETSCSKPGVLAHDHCNVCNKDFINGVEKNKAELTIEQLEHTWVDDVCTVCHETRNTEGLLFNLNSDGQSYYIFRYVGTATKVRIADTYNGLPITTIRVSTFSGCNWVTDIIISSNVQTIQEMAFYECSSLESIVIPAGVKIISGRLFEDCTSLVSVSLPDSIETIERNAFYGCIALKNINMPNGISSIGTSAFSLCESLESFTFPTGLSSIGGITFYGCISFKTITIPGNIKEVTDLAFYLCTGLESVIIEEGVLKIDGAFYACNNIKSISLPQSLTTIGDITFNGCTALENIVLPSNLQTIGKQVFNGCLALKSLVIPSSVVNFGKMNFEACTIRTINCKAISKPEGWDENWLGKAGVTVVWGYND